MHLLDYLKSMPADERQAFAGRCGTSPGHMNNVAYGYKPCGESLAINIERESRLSPCSGEFVTVEELCPDVDWAVIRGKPAPAAEAEERVT